MPSGKVLLLDLRSCMGGLVVYIFASSGCAHIENALQSYLEGLIRAMIYAFWVST